MKIHVHYQFSFQKVLEYSFINFFMKFHMGISNSAPNQLNISADENDKKEQKETTQTPSKFVIKIIQLNDHLKKCIKFLVKKNYSVFLNCNEFTKCNRIIVPFGMKIVNCTNSRFL